MNNVSLEQVVIYQEVLVVVAFCLTCHKIQGQSIIHPATVAMDLESCWGGGMAYVMLSRIQRISQLFNDSCPRSRLLSSEVIRLTDKKTVRRSPPRSQRRLLRMPELGACHNSQYPNTRASLPTTTSL